MQPNLESLREGQCVRIRYQDHVLWADENPAKFDRPLILEACGWIQVVNETAVRLVFERLAVPSTLPKSGRFLPEGLTIVKSTILEAEAFPT